jgi:hypothetical protein
MFRQTLSSSGHTFEAINNPNAPTTRNLVPYSPLGQMYLAISRNMIRPVMESLVTPTPTFLVDVAVLASTVGVGGTTDFAFGVGSFGSGLGAAD